jgi:CelD/BcsL family acetyltransferase involved in cellulose biosynthesis
MRELVTTVVDQACALAALEDAWWGLWRRSAAATPFQSPAWLLPWWTAFEPGQLFAIAVHARDRLVGLAPFYIEHGVRGRRILPIGISLSDYLDVLLDPEWAGVAGRALVNELSRQGAKWDACEFEELKPEAAAVALPCPAGSAETNGAQSACPVLPLACRDGLRHVPSGTRRKLRMARHRAGRRQIEIFAPSPARWREFLEDLCRLHEARWRSRERSGVLAEEPVRAFHRRAAPRLLAAGIARLYGARIEGRLAGAYYGLADRGVAYAYLGGFDPDFAFESPGTLLLGHAIEQAAQVGAGEFDFLRGREAYKYAWGGADRWNRRRSFRRRETAVT